MFKPVTWLIKTNANNYKFYKFLNTYFIIVGKVKQINTILVYYLNKIKTKYSSVVGDKVERQVEGRGGDGGVGQVATSCPHSITFENISPFLKRVGKKNSLIGQTRTWSADYTQHASRGTLVVFDVRAAFRRQVWTATASSSAGKHAGLLLVKHPLTCREEADGTRSARCRSPACRSERGINCSQSGAVTLIKGPRR